MCPGPEDKGDPLADRGAPNLSHAELERLRIQALMDDPGGLKKPRHLGAPWHKNFDGGQG